MKPILFNSEMVRAILEGRKTVTRRVISKNIINQCDIDTDDTIIGYCDGDGDWHNIEKLCRYKAGDVIYVRETWSKDSFDNYVYRVDYAGCTISPNWKWHPSIHMPKEAARIWLKVTDVRVERLQDIDTAGMLDEGIPFCGNESAIHEDFINTWNSTILKKKLEQYGWETNPWVWVIGFERMVVQNER